MDSDKAPLAEAVGVADAPISGTGRPVSGLTLSETGPVAALEDQFVRPRRGFGKFALGLVALAAGLGATACQPAWACCVPPNEFVRCKDIGGCKGKDPNGRTYKGWTWYCCDGEIIWACVECLTAAISCTETTAPSHYLCTDWYWTQHC